MHFQKKHKLRLKYAASCARRRSSDCNSKMLFLPFRVVKGVSEIGDTRSGQVIFWRAALVLHFYFWDFIPKEQLVMCTPRCVSKSTCRPVISKHCLNKKLEAI